MTEFDPAPEAGGPQRRWQEGTDTFGRVYAVVLGVMAPTAYTDIANLADCSPNAAKKHLERLAEMGVVDADRESRPARYERNDGYLEWQEASRIATELSVEDIIDRVEALEARRSEYEAQFGTPDPAAVSVFDRDDRDGHDNREEPDEPDEPDDQGEHEQIHERMRAVTAWQGVIRDVRLYELARQLSQNDGHLLPA